MLHRTYFGLNIIHFVHYSYSHLNALKSANYYYLYTSFKNSYMFRQRVAIFRESQMQRSTSTNTSDLEVRCYVQIVILFFEFVVAFK